MAMKLTRRQQEVLAFMRSFLVDNDQLPPVHVISRHFGFAAQNGAHDHVRALEKKGAIERNAVGKYRLAREKAGS